MAMFVMCYVGEVEQGYLGDVLCRWGRTRLCRWCERNYAGKVEQAHTC